MSSQAPLNEEEVDRFTEESVLYFLSQHSKNATIRRPDYVKTVLTDTNRRMQNEVLKRTRSTLKRVRILYVNLILMKFCLDKMLFFSTGIWFGCPRNR